jgi:hypothetical protein
MRDRVAIYALTRGYPWRYFYRYGFLIVRNHFLRLSLLKYAFDKSFDWLIFHEGNISRAQRALICILSLKFIRFVDVSIEFKPTVTESLESEFPIGYHLMCRFQYWGVWKHLVGYTWALRVDEDCISVRVPFFDRAVALATGCTSRETHAPTLRSMSSIAETLDPDVPLTEMNFPYTNMMVVNPDVFLGPQSLELLKSFYLHPRSFQDGWGDLPILGLVAKAVSEPGVVVDSRTIYFHASHFSWVKGGELIESKD